MKEKGLTQILYVLSSDAAFELDNIAAYLEDCGTSKSSRMD